MISKRRDFIKKSIVLGVGSMAAPAAAYSIAGKGNGPQSDARQGKMEAIEKAAARPVLRRELFAYPVIIESVDLLEYGGNYLCKIRAVNGAEGICISNNYKMVHLYPIFQQQVAPFFIGKDARDLDALLEGVYTYKSNYKMQSYALWVPVATVEFAILDLLGKMAGEPMSALLGEVHNETIGVYQANNFRGKSAEESIELIKEQMAETDSKALKFKVGGRMSNNADDPSGRTENLIPLIRKTFGEDMVVYADSNGSYTPEEAIRIGRMMEEEHFDFYEEPVPFDWYQETRQVTEALNIPIAGGEQESSMHNFKWLIENDALDIVQPDIFYFGGMVRSMKIARMAHAVGKTCVPHISGSGLGYLYMMHFVSVLPNAGPYHEFKGFNAEIPLSCDTSDLKIKDGRIKVPTGPGLGVDIDPEFIAKHKEIKC
ncbi:MAG: mandelate racemase/muconate lactonizing enzyme family protein [Pricia sp.]